MRRWGRPRCALLTYGAGKRRDPDDASPGATPLEGDPLSRPPFCELPHIRMNLALPRPAPIHQCAAATLTSRVFSLLSGIDPLNKGRLRCHDEDDAVDRISGGDDVERGLRMEMGAGRTALLRMKREVNGPAETGLPIARLSEMNR